MGQGRTDRHDGATREVRRRDSDATADADSGSKMLILIQVLIRFDADAHGPALALASRHSPLPTVNTVRHVNFAKTSYNRGTLD